MQKLHFFLIFINQTLVIPPSTPAGDEDQDQEKRPVDTIFNGPEEGSLAGSGEEGGISVPSPPTRILRSQSRSRSVTPSRAKTHLLPVDIDNPVFSNIDRQFRSRQIDTPPSFLPKKSQAPPHFIAAQKSQAFYTINSSS